MQMDWLADILLAEGLTVEEHTGWKKRTMRHFDRFHPVGIINHHTAGSKVIPNYPDPPFYRNEALQTKCNLTIRPNGVVVVLNAGYAFDSGKGTPLILEVVQADGPLPSLTGLKSKVTGNPWFIDIEVQHLGNGSPIVAVQREALIATNAAICRHLEWDPRTRVIGHREWAPDRKPDPKWDGKANPMPQIRDDTFNLKKPIGLSRIADTGDTVHPPNKHTEYVKDHQLSAGPPSWSPWEDYVEASGSKPESGGWPAGRYDFAWFWKKFIKPLFDLVAKGRTDHAAHEERLAKLEARPDIDQIVDEVLRRLSEKDG